MCGIFGLVNPKKRNLKSLDLVSEDPLYLAEKSLRLLRHRGPDEQACFVYDNNIFAYVRLALIDVKHGGQPIFNTTNDICIIYNGEIYDVAEHIHLLQKKGYVFKTRSDTEVVLKMYEEFGYECVEYLNGEFSFIIHDLKNNTTFVARDYWGTKPLYYSKLSHGGFGFCSDIKPLLWMQNQTPNISKLAVAQVLEGWAALPPTTSFDNIYQIPPRSYGVIDQHGLTVRNYEFSTKYLISKTDSTNVVDLLRDSIKRRLVADVPVGVYLSGGLDSSIVAKLAYDEIGSNLQTFSIQFEDKQYDESSAQSAMRSVLKCKHHEIIINNKQINQNFCDAVFAGESVVFRNAFVPMYLLSRLVHKHNIKAVITGEGSDELFGGYDIYKEHFILQNWAENPEDSKWAEAIVGLYKYLPMFQDERSKLFLKQFYKGFLDKKSSDFFSHITRWSGYTSVKSLFNEPLDSPLTTTFKEHYSSIFKNKEHLPRDLELLTLLHGYLLSTQGDKMASAHSLEVRLPFLDKFVAAYAMQKTPSQHLHQMKEKYVLYESFKDILPNEIIQRTKQPYVSADAEVFLGKDADAWWKDYFAKQKLEALPFLNTDKVIGFTKRIETMYEKTGAIARKDNTAFIAILSASLLANDFKSQLNPNNQSDFHMKMVQRPS
jgi:asparagine synthase (glutamine-hydrolysing)